MLRQDIIEQQKKTRKLNDIESVQRFGDDKPSPAWAGHKAGPDVNILSPSAHPPNPFRLLPQAVAKNIYNEVSRVPYFRLLDSTHYSAPGEPQRYAPERDIRHRKKLGKDAFEDKANLQLTEKLFAEFGKGDREKYEKVARYLKAQRSLPYRVVSNYKAYLGDHEGRTGNNGTDMSSWLTGQANKNPELLRGHDGGGNIRSLPQFIKHLEDTQGAWRDTRDRVRGITPFTAGVAETQLMDTGDVMKYISSRPNERFDGENRSGKGQRGKELQSPFHPDILPHAGNHNYVTSRNMEYGAVNRFGIKGMTPPINFVDGNVEMAPYPNVDMAWTPYGPGMKYGDPNFIDLRDSRLVLPSTGVEYGNTKGVDRLVNRFGTPFGSFYPHRQKRFNVHPQNEKTKAGGWTAHSSIYRGSAKGKSGGNAKK